MHKVQFKRRHEPVQVSNLLQFDCGVALVLGQNAEKRVHGAYNDGTSDVRFPSMASFNGSQPIAPKVMLRIVFGLAAQLTDLLRVHVSQLEALMACQVMHKLMVAALA